MFICHLSCIQNSKLTKWSIDDEASYDILGYVFSSFLCIWRQIRCNLEK